MPPFHETLDKTQIFHRYINQCITICQVFLLLRSSQGSVLGQLNCWITNTCPKDEVFYNEIKTIRIGTDPRLSFQGGAAAEVRGEEARSASWCGGLGFQFLNSSVD
jgi:hypothetical protein